METLPVEILTHIFKFLNVADRKEAALVCRQWYNASLHPALLRDITLQLSAASLTDISILSKRANQHIKLKDGSSASLGDLLKTATSADYFKNVVSLSLQDTDITPNLFMMVVGKCSNLQALDLSRCNSLFMSGQLLSSQADVDELKHTLVNLETLNLSAIRYMSDFSFNRITEACPNIRTLILSGCKLLFHSRKTYYANNAEVFDNKAVLTFDNFLNFLEQHPKIEALDLSLTGLTDEALMLVASVPDLHLKAINLNQCKEIFDEGIITLCKKQLQLECLLLDTLNCEFGDPALFNITTNLTNLKVLHMVCRQITDNSVSKLRQLCHLEELYLSSYSVSSKGLSLGLCSGSLNQLTYLNLSCCVSIDDSFIMELCQVAKQLVRLNLGSCQKMGDVGMQSISCHLIHLQKLQITWCKSLTDLGLLGLKPDPAHVHVFDEGLCKCMRRENVTTNLLSRSLPAELSKPDISPDDITERLLNEVDAVPISNLSKLRQLDLSSCTSLTDNSIMRAIRFHELTTLYLNLCNAITDQSVEAISKNLPSLERLYLNQCKLLTDWSICEVARRSRRLTHLNVSCIDNLTDKTVNALVTYSQRLRMLDVTMCGTISPDAIYRLENTLPYIQEVKCRLIGHKLNQDEKKKSIKAQADMLKTNAQFKFSLFRKK